MKLRKTLQNQKGSATLEGLSVLVVFILFMGYTVGMFGVVHTGILNSIVARTYAFETFRGRANLTYFRDFPRDGSFSDFKMSHYARVGFRVHGITSEFNTNQEWIVTTRDLTRGIPGPDPVNAKDSGYHTRALSSAISPGAAEKEKANPVWIKTVYGICLNSNCAGRAI